MAKRKAEIQPKLFGDSSVEVAYILTNQNNLNYILSNGWIVPHEVYSKYYPDPSEHTPGFIPLLLLPPSEEFVRATVKQSATSFPVLIEINIIDLQGEIPVVDKSGTVVTKANCKELNENHLLILLHGAIPLNRIKIVYFREETELKEFTVRPYTSRRDIMTSISRDMFASANGISLDLIKAAISKSKFTRSLDIRVYQIASAFAGVALLLSNALVVSQYLPISVIHSWMYPLFYQGEYVNLLKGSGGTFPTIDYWLIYASSLLWKEDAQINTSEIETGYYSEMTERQISDTILFRLVVEKLLEYEGPHNFVSEQFLREIIPNLSVRLEKVLPDHAEHLLVQYKLLFERMGQVLEGSIGLDEFFAFLSIDTVVTKALLCFLLRHRPADVLSWDNDLNANDWGTLAVAVLLSGLLYRRSRIPAANDKQSRLLDFVDYLTANTINKFVGSAHFADLEDELKHEILDDRSSQLLYKDIILLVKQPPNETEHYVDMLLATKFDDPNNEKIGVLLAQRMGWDHCLTSAVQLNGREFALQYHTGRKELRVVGPVQVQLQLNIVEFIKQLGVTDRSKIKAQLDLEIQRLLS